MKKYLLAIFVFSFLIYNLNLSFLYSFGKGDTTPARLLPFNILLGKGIYFDDFIKFFPQDPDTLFFFQKINGHYLSSYSLLPGLISLPIYLPFYLVLKFNNLAQIDNLFQYSFFLEKLSASIFASFTTALFFLFMFKLSNKIKTSLIFTFIFGFASQMLPSSSQYLWQHTPANLLAVISLIFFLLGLNLKKRSFFYFALVSSGISVFSRQIFSIFDITILSVICLSDKKRIKSYFAIFLVPIVLLLGFNLYNYNTAFGGYGTYLSSFSPTTFLQGLEGLIFSPARGILFYVPFYLLAFIAPFYYKKATKLDMAGKKIFSLCLFNLFAVLILNSFWDYWWGGHTFGARLLSDGLIYAVVLCYFIFSWVKNKLFKVIFTAIIIYSFFIQLVGFAYSPKSFWDDYPKDVSDDLKRLWQFEDNPIVRSLVLGPKLDGWYNLINWSSGLRNNIYPPSQNKCSLDVIDNKKMLGYDVLEINFQNKSSVDWLTTGVRGYDLTLRQVFINKSDKSAFESLIGAKMPRIIRAGETVRVEVVLIPPDTKDYNVVIFPSQSEFSWFNSCNLTNSG